MVPLRLLMRTPILLLALALAAQPARALTNALTITATAYVDSRVSNQTLNYGRAHTVKALVNSNVTSDGSVCRGLFQLPPQFWAYPPEQILSAKVVFYVWQDNSGSRDVTLYPLTTAFVPGTGTGTGASPADGATWITSDGVTPWASPGGDFDPAHPVVGVKGRVLDPDLNDRFFYWDITALLKSAAARTALQNCGAMLRMDETPPPAAGASRAPFTSSYDPSYTPACWPTLQFTVAPTLAGVSVSGGAVSFGISNLTVGVTNTIERALDPSANNWTAVASFVAAGPSTNWSEPLPPGWTKAFYRLRSQK